MRRRAELSSSAIVGLLLLVMGVVLVVIIYATIDWTGTTNREVCHASVVARGAIPKIAQAVGVIPLNCKTKKICITKKGTLFGIGGG